MKNPINKDIGLLILRIGFAGAMLPHGLPKLTRLVQHGSDAPFPDPLGAGPIPTLIFAIVAELLCPIFIAIGFRTRIATLPLIITMTVAAFLVHAGDPWAEKEMAVLYLIGYLAIALMGPGRYALQRD